jgi:SAM-dependent methyltransferase
MNCDGIARYYERLERLSFGKSLEKTRFTFLGETHASHRAILCGGGDGRFLARLLCANPRVEVDFVDLSPKMVEVASRRIAPMGASFRDRVRFRTADVREFQPRPEGYDLIVTNFFLDCFSELELAKVVARLASSATPHALWILSDFREADGVLGRLWTGAVIRSLYAAFRMTTGLRVTSLPDYSSALARRGYLLRREERALGGLLFSSLWEGRA